MDKTLFHYMISLQLGSNLCALGLTTGAGTRKTNKTNLCHVKAARRHAGAGSWFEKNNDMQLHHMLNARTPSGCMSMKRINTTPTTLGIPRGVRGVRGLPNSRRRRTPRRPEYFHPGCRTCSLSRSLVLSPSPQSLSSLVSSALVSIPLPLHMSQFGRGEVPAERYLGIRSKK